MGLLNDPLFRAARWLAENQTARMTAPSKLNGRTRDT